MALCVHRACKNRTSVLRLDDPLGIGAVHGACGFLGLVLEGVFSCHHFRPGLIHGGWHHFGVQVAGAVAIVAANVVVSGLLWLCIMKPVFRRSNLRVGALDTYLVSSQFSLTGVRMKRS